MNKAIILAFVCICVFVSIRQGFAQGPNQPPGGQVTLKQRLLLIEGYCDAIAFSPDGTKAVCAAGKWIASNKCIAELWKKVVVWDLMNNKQIQVLTGHEEWVAHVAFSEDGKKVIGVLGVPGSDLRKPSKTHVLTWDLDTGKLIGRASAPRRSNERVLSLCKHGTRLLTSAESWRDGQVLVYDVDVECKERFSVKVDKLLATAISPDGSMLATASFVGDETVSSPGNVPVQVWSLDSGKKEASFEITNTEDWGHLVGHGLQFSGDGKVLCAILLDRMSYCWSIPQKKSLGIFEFGLNAISPDGRYALPTNGGIVSLKSGKRVAELTIEGLEGPRIQPNWHLSRGTRGNFACAGSGDEIRIWEIPKGIPE